MLGFTTKNIMIFNNRIYKHAQKLCVLAKPIVEAHEVNYVEYEDGEVEYIEHFHDMVETRTV